MTEIDTEKLAERRRGPQGVQRQPSDEFRANGGHVGVHLRSDIVLLTTTARSPGSRGCLRWHTSRLDGQMLVAGSYGDHPRTQRGCTTSRQPRRPCRVGANHMTSPPGSCSATARCVVRQARRAGARLGDYQAQISRLIPLFELSGRSAVARADFPNTRRIPSQHSGLRPDTGLNLEVKRESVPRHTRRRRGILVRAGPQAFRRSRSQAYPTARLTPSPRS